MAELNLCADQIDAPERDRARPQRHAPTCCKSPCLAAISPANCQTAL